VIRPETRARLQLLLAVFLPGVFAFTFFHNPAELIAAVAAVAVVVLVVAPRLPQAVPARVRSAALRERAERAAHLRLRDPDAAGRPRPRAPGCQG
jgi:hypothetical protein